MNLEQIQHALATQQLEGWLFYDFRGSDPLAYSILGLPTGRLLSRRWFYFIPVTGKPVKIVHAIETTALDVLPGERLVYLPWQQLQENLRSILAGRKRIAMQYSPCNAIPYVSRVDAGTIDLVRSYGVAVVSAAPLIQQFESTLTAAQIGSHHLAAAALARLVQETFTELAARLRTGKTHDEYALQRFLIAGLEREQLVTEHEPIIAAGSHSADPHYQPTAQSSSPIGPDTLVLLDVWGKQKQLDAVYADITWTAFTGATIPAKVAEVFTIVRQARDATIDCIRAAFAAGQRVRGCDADDVCRKVIVEAGYGAQFVHRTGHSIHTTLHGNGANLDNLETADYRPLLPATLFSVEPGIYLPGEFGIRSEVDVLLTPAGEVTVTGATPQSELIRLA